MARLALSSLLPTLLLHAVRGERHAVLVAGSSGFSNYRHQADVAHAYAILTAGGVPAENIITMMYDDVAHSWQNKLRGRLYNRPDAPEGSTSGTPAPDVYSAIKDHIDYKKGHVTPTNFLKVLT